MTQIIASECFAGLFPQNSLSGFKYCVDHGAHTIMQDAHKPTRWSGVDGVEFDVHLSVDGHVVVQHDYFLNKRITRDARGQRLQSSGAPLCQRTLNDLKGYDIGRYQIDTHEALEYPDYQPIDGELIPTLDEFLLYHTQQNSACELWIELKTSPFQRESSSDPNALVDAVLACIERFGVAQHCVLLAFEWDVLVRARRLNSAIRTNFLTVNSALMRSLNRRNGEVDCNLLFGSAAPVDEARCWESVKTSRGDWWGPYVQDATKTAVASAQNSGVKVNLWGVDSSIEGLEFALSLGADAVTLGRPDFVRGKKV